MRAVASETSTEKTRSELRATDRRLSVRKNRLRSAALEWLESRTLMATLPTVLLDPTAPRSPVISSTGNQSAPSIAIDPMSPNKMAAVWVRNDPSSPTGAGQAIYVEAAYSTDAGANWTKLTGAGVRLGQAAGFAQITDPSVAFDAHDHLFVSLAAHSADYTSGQVLLERFDFTASTPTQTLSDGVVTAWPVGGGPLFKPTLAVDANQSTFNDSGGYTQSDPSSSFVVGANTFGGVYVAGSISGALVVSSSKDGGATFTTNTVNTGADFGVSPKITVSQGRPSSASGGHITGSGVTGGQVSVVWDDINTLAGSGRDRIMVASGNWNGAAMTFAAPTMITTTQVRGSIGLAAYPNVATFPAVADTGVGPAPAIASDNTLGTFSPYQGFLYVAYVDRGTGPVDNTDIRLAVSKDGGLTWSVNARPVNDDAATLDGFSQGDRPQFQPQVAIDQATGTLVASWLDARNDAARRRVATYVSASNDGGVTFSPNTFVNTPRTAVDAITGRTVTLGPVPDNQSTGNPKPSDSPAGTRDATFNFGDHQGLAVYAGKIFPVWTSNANGGASGTQLNNIVLARAETAAGPRVTAITQGVVGDAGDPLNATPRGSDLGPQLSKFVVSFDRPIDLSTLSPADFILTYVDPNGSTTVLPSNFTFTAAGNVFGTTSVTVNLQTPATAVGSYKLALKPNYRSGIRRVVNAGTILNVQVDQNANGTAGEVSADLFQNPDPSQINDTLPLTIPGPHVASTSVPGGGAGNLVLNGSVSFIDLTFDRAINGSTFTPASVIRMVGPAGAVPGPFTVTALNSTTFRVGFPKQVFSGNYTLTLASDITDTKGNALDSNENAGVYVVRGATPYVVATPNVYNASDTPKAIPDYAAGNPGVATSTINIADDFAVQGVSLQLNITHPNDPDLKISLVGPDGTTVVLVQNSGSGVTTANFSNTGFDDTVNPAAPISQGSAPFFGKFNPLQSLNTAFVTGHPGGAIHSVGVWKLVIEDSSPGGVGTLASWSLTLLSRIPGTGLGEPVADQASVGFRLFIDDPANKVATTTWTSTGPAPIVSTQTNGLVKAGRIGAIAVDPSDPSGNTVYAGAAQGGVWKTTNFLTADAAGPTWIPLTDFGPTSGINVGTIAVFPRGNDPTKSLVIVGTGDVDTNTRGVGFLRSNDGGLTWALLDSLDNSKQFSGRDHSFGQGSFVYKVVFDPRLTSGTSQVIAYAAVSGTNGGVYRSLDGGTTWKRLRAGAATDVTLDPISGTGVVGGNLQNVYAAFAGDGVYSSPNQGQSWFGVLGTTGNPLVQDFVSGAAIPVATPAGSTPNGAKGRILLGKPTAISPNTTQPLLSDQLYQGWLYALVVNAGGNLDGLYLTKDFGQNWTKVRMPDAGGATPSNNETLADVAPFGNGGSFDSSLAIDPTNPNVVYIGGAGGATSLIRVDTTGLFDPHAFFAYDGSRPDTGLVQTGTVGAVTTTNKTSPAFLIEPPTRSGTPVASSYLNLIRDPQNVFNVNATLLTSNVSQFNNTGAGAKWVPYASASPILGGSYNIHRLITFPDPTTGRPRLIFGDDFGIYTGVDFDGTFNASLPKGDAATGLSPLILGNRDGNLTATQFYYGGVQPSAHDLLNNVREVLLYGGTRQFGPIISGPVLSTGGLAWSGPESNALAVVADPTGSGTVFRFLDPAVAGTNFFQVNGVGRTFNLTTGPTDPQWFNIPPSSNGSLTPFGNFAVNPVNGNQIAISSNVGRVFRTENQGGTWFVIADPASSGFDGTYAPAVAFGAPDPSAPSGVGNLDNFMYVGTTGGHIYVTTTGGGGASNAWKDISAGLDGSTVQRIMTNPLRGSHEAYAVTLKGVFHTVDSLTSPWVNITGNLFSLKTPSYGDAASASTLLTSLTALQVDWRYAIPNNPANPAAGVHPVLYVSGLGGVFRSISGGGTWTQFPSADSALDAAPVDGGFLPNVQVSDLGMAIGNVNPSNGRPTPVDATDPSMLVASTFGRGQFAIRLAPTVMTNTKNNPPDYIVLDPSSIYASNLNGYQVTTKTNPIIDGTSEITGFGASVRIALFDLANPAAPVPIPLTGSTLTDGTGRFSVQVAPGYYTTSGFKTVGVQATDQTGAKGNIAPFTFVLDINPAPAPTNLTLDASADSGTYNNDEYTWNDNGKNAAPLFDVSGVLPGATVVLLRNGVEVNRVLNTPGGVVQIADLNAGAGKIADNPVGNPPDTAPPAGNPYFYSAYQIDIYQVQGANYTPPLPLIIDTTAPAAPASITLQGSSDSGRLNTDNYTWFNNSGAHAAPVFDVTGIEPHATLRLLRAQLVNGTLSTPVVVNTLVDVTPTGANGLVSIADINGGLGPIPDSPVGNPADTAPPGGNPYVYSAIQVDLAGNLSQQASFGNSGAVVLDGTDSDLHGSNDNTGANVGGWLYMQKVLAAIQPNVTDGQKTLVAIGARPNGIASNAIGSAFTQALLPLGWTIEYVNGTANIDTYLAGNPAVATDRAGAALGNVTITQTGMLYIPSANETFDDLTDADLVMLNTHGPDIKSYVVRGGGLYSQGQTNSGAPATQTPQGYGWLTSIFPGITYFAVGGGGQSPSSIALTTQGQAIFPGLTNADLQGGPWHGYFGGTFSGGLVPMMTVDDNGGVNRVLGVASVGGISASNQLIIDTVAPVAPVSTLDAASDTGTYNNDLVTNRNNSPSPGNAPVFDLTGLEPNVQVDLFRALVNPVTGLPGASVRVATFIENSVGGNDTIADTNNGAGVIADGKYVYTMRQTDLAGNVGAFSTPLTVIIDAAAPSVPTSLALDPIADSGTFNNDKVTKFNNGLFPAPLFDVAGVESRASLKLFRAPVVGGVVGTAVLVRTITDVTVGPGGTITVTDTNAGAGQIPDGTYAYTVQQLDLAGNPSGVSAPALTVIIDTKVPLPAPLPAPDLEASSDTGTFNDDNITQANNGPIYPAPIFDIGTAARPIDKAATVELWRAPVNPVTGVAGTPVLVNRLTNVKAGVVAIADLNGGNGVIPDGTYLYTSRLSSLSGIVGAFSPALRVVINANPPGVPNPFRLDAASDTGVSNSDGITQITLVRFPVFDASGIIPGATLNLFRNSVLVTQLTNTAGGTVQIIDSGTIADGSYVYTVQQIDLQGNASPIGNPITVVFDTAQPGTPSTPTLDPSSDTGTKGDNITSVTAPKINVPVIVAGFDLNSQVTLVRDGAVVARSTYSAATGTVSLVDPGPVPFGTHSYQAFLTDRAGNISSLGGRLTVVFSNDLPGTLTLDPASDSGVAGDNITNVTNPTFQVAGVLANNTLQLLRNGLTVTTKPSGAGGVVKITDAGPLVDGRYVYTVQQVDALGNVSPAGPPLTLTVDTSVPAGPTGFKLDALSDTGILGDNVTSITNPTFDAAGILSGSTVKLFRDGVLVAGQIQLAAGVVQITDPGPVATATYTYTIQQVSAAGNTSPAGTPLSIRIDTTVPGGPTLTLNAGSDSGPKGDNITNVTNPTFNASGVVPGASLRLYRAGLLVRTLPNVGNVGGVIQIQDPGPLADGSYIYTAQQTSPAGTVSAVGAAYTVTINTAQPATPNTPTLALAAGADTGIKGDLITAARRPVITGSADPGVTVTLTDALNNPFGTGVADALGNFIITAPLDLADGSYPLKAQARDGKGALSAFSALLPLTIVSVAGDFSGSARTTPYTFRRTLPGLGQWFVSASTLINGYGFGSGALDVPISGDFNGDGKADLGLFRPSTSTWYSAPSPTYAGQVMASFGGPIDIPVPGNWDGTGVEVPAVFRPSTGQWFIHGAGGNRAVNAIFAPGDVPVPSDFDGIGRTEAVVFRPSTAQWFVAGPTDLTPRLVATFGGNNFVPVPGVYLAPATVTPGKATPAVPAVFNPSTGEFFVYVAGGTNKVYNFAPNDIPAPGDYDGTGLTEPAVFRPSSQQFLVQGANDAAPRVIATLGTSKDIPVLAPYPYRAIGGSGGISVSGFKTNSLNLGSSAQNLSSSLAPVTAVVKTVAAAPPVSTPAPVHHTVRYHATTPKARRAQAAAQHGHAVDHVLASLTDTVKGRRHKVTRPH